MFSKRNVLSKRAGVLASLALIGARAQTEEESRLLVAVVAPKVTAVGGDAAGDGFATVSFKTGPNLVSYDYSVSCYTRNLTIPTTSCNAISANNIAPAGNSVDGETGKAYSKIVANVTGLAGDEIYDCFVNTYGPAGYDKCKYVGSTDVDCFPTDPVTIEDTSRTDIPDPTASTQPELILDYEIADLGNPAMASAAPDVLGFACVPGAANAVTCPSTTLSADLLTVDFPAYPGTTSGTQTFSTSTNTGTATPVAVVGNSEYTCFSLIDDTCADVLGAPPTCSDPFELVSAPAIATTVSFASAAAGTITPACTYDTNADGDALDVSFWWGCYQPTATPPETAPTNWFQVDCTATPPLPSQAFAASGAELYTCILFQGQGPPATCNPFNPAGCNWSTDGNAANWGGYQTSLITVT